MSGSEQRRHKKRRIRWFSILAGLLVVGLFVAAVIPKRVQVDMIEVERGDLLVTVDEDGQTRVKDRYCLLYTSPSPRDS